jgi:flavin-dependent dehydrogenase
MKSVKILGAGPAGLAAAINLSQNGYNVDIFERNLDVGNNINGNLQGLENWSGDQDVIEEFKKMNIKTNFHCEPFNNLRITNSKENWDFSCERPAFYVLKRGTDNNSLDQGLKKQALDNGVNIRFGETAPISDVDIVATGGDPKFKFAVGKGISFETEHKNVAVGLVNNYHAFKGYSYLLVSNGFGCIATVLFEGFQDLNKYFKRTLDEFQSNFDLDEKYPHKFSGYGSFSNQIMKREDQILIGEIAGFQDLLWGFGIRNAVKSGFIASKSILDGKECKDYYKIAENYFKPKLNSSIVNRFIWEKFASNNYSIILNRIYNSNDPLKYLNSFHNFNFLQKLIYPFALFYMKYRYPNLKL